MTSVEDLLRALPIRDIKVRAGVYSNCGGVALALVDLEPGTAEGIEVVDAVTELPDWAKDVQDIVEFCVENIGVGVRAAFRDVLGAEPAVRVVVRRVNPSSVDANESVNQRAGRLVVEEAVRMAGL